MSDLYRWFPQTLQGQMIAILAISLILLLSVVAGLELATRVTPIEWAESGSSMSRLVRMRTLIEHIDPAQRGGLIKAISECHDGYTLTQHAFAPVETTPRTAALKAKISKHLSLEDQIVSVGQAKVTRADFSYGTCDESEIDLPMSAIVVSARLGSGEWLNVEMHPHEWHLDSLIEKILRYSAACILVGALAIVLMHRLSKPLGSLTRAAQRFGEGLNVSPVAEVGPLDVRRAIESFNAMQRQVADEVSKRTDTLTAISHDLRTPLTALRIKAELLEDDASRSSLVASIERMERLIASALEFLRGESRSEPLRTIDLSAMLASECSDFEEAGQQAEYIGGTDVYYACRSEALARAVRNLIDNANKYGNGARVDLRTGPESLDISVSDTGPGIRETKFAIALEPFRRLSKARESAQGGFGLGLAVAHAVAKGHGGELILSGNSPSGLIATIRLPPASGVQSRGRHLPLDLPLATRTAELNARKDE